MEYFESVDVFISRGTFKIGFDDQTEEVLDDEKAHQDTPDDKMNPNLDIVILDVLVSCLVC